MQVTRIITSSQPGPTRIYSSEALWKTSSNSKALTVNSPASTPTLVLLQLSVVSIPSLTTLFFFRFLFIRTPPPSLSRKCFFSTRPRCCTSRAAAAEGAPRHMTSLWFFCPALCRKLSDGTLHAGRSRAHSTQRCKDTFLNRFLLDMQDMHMIFIIENAAR